MPSAAFFERRAKLRVALVHHWLVTMRGGERVLEALCELFPQAEIFTHVYVPERVSDTLRARKVHTSFIQKLPFAAKLYQRYLPFMPAALEGFDLRNFDLVITSDSGPVKGVVTTPDTLHICYCHTPMRYVWGMQQEYLVSRGFITRTMFSLITHYVRLWDYAAAARVDYFISNSRAVARRVRKFYRRDTEVIWPPVACDRFEISEQRSEFYLVVGQLVPYKRVDLAVEACTRLGRRLVIIGEGSELERLKRSAGPTVSFLGSQNFDELRRHYATCRALLFPGEEDFGIVPVEAMASGRPVIALRSGGALDTIKERETGVFFDEQTVASLSDAILRFEQLEPTFDPVRIAAYARRFGEDEFKRRFADFVVRCLSEHDHARTLATEPIETLQPADGRGAAPPFCE